MPQPQELRYWVWMIRNYGPKVCVVGPGFRLIIGPAVLLLANGIIRTAKQLREVSRTAVWGRAALYLAGASCDWWGGNIEKLIG
jgi:hypothetical protein